MARSYDDKLARCPYFTKYDLCRIHCEGYADEARCAVITAFETAGDRRSYGDKYCNDNYSKCRLYGIIDAKYSDDR